MKTEKKKVSFIAEVLESHLCKQTRILKLGFTKNAQH